MSFGSGNGSAVPATFSGISHFQRDSLGSPSDRPKDDPVDVKSNTVLERSHNFLPISPTSSTSVPPIMITAFWQESESQLARINAYLVLFLVSTNVRRQLTISLKIPKTSKYWTTTKVSKEPFSCVDCMDLAEAGSLPQTLQDRVCHFLSSQDGLHENDHISLALSDEDDALKDVPQDPGLQQTYAAERLPLSSPDGRLTMAAYLENLGCSLYSEQDVHTITTLQPPKRFLAFVDGALVEEVMCNRNPPSANFLDSIQAFHDMREVPGLLQLKGIVFDDSRMALRSYLLELPKTKCTLLLEHLSGPNHTSWKDREVCARKLIEMVSQVHSKGYVVGILRRRRLPVVVDTFGDLHLCQIEATLSFGACQQTTDPPEFCAYWSSYDKSTSDHKAPKLTSESDIYQLGLVLWVMAESWTEQTTATSVRRRFRGYSQPPYMNTERGLFSCRHWTQRCQNTTARWWRPVERTNQAHDQPQCNCWL